MKGIFWLMMLYPSLSLQAQEMKINGGIKWEQGLSWNQIKEKAKAEAKNIFLDCFATWCGPCKVMDKDIYPNDSLGKIMNAKFICARVQMDQTSIDDEQTKKWYKDAEDIQKSFSVSVFPTFLFFSNDGTPLHKDVGSKNVPSFLDMVNSAFNPKRQYFFIRSKYESGKIDTADAKELSRALKYVDEELAAKIAAEYLSRIPKEGIGKEDNLFLMMEMSHSHTIQQIVIRYLKGLKQEEFVEEKNQKLFSTFRKNEDVVQIAVRYLQSLPVNALDIPANKTMAQLFKKDEMVKKIANKYINSLQANNLLTVQNIPFLAAFINSSTDRGFKIFYTNQRIIDSVMDTRKKQANVYSNSKYSQPTIDNIIYKEEVSRYLKSITEKEDPKKIQTIPWEKIGRSIETKYSKADADRIILNARVSLYGYLTSKFNKYWEEYIGYRLELIERYGTDTTNGYSDATVLNNFCYDAIFLHCTNEEQLNKGIEIMEDVIGRHPDDEEEIDTYAALLYKTGRKKEAIDWEEKALAVAIRKKSDYYIKLFGETINKMKNNEQTW